MTRRSRASGMFPPPTCTVHSHAIVRVAITLTILLSTTAQAATQMERAAAEKLKLSRFTLESVSLPLAPSTASIPLELGAEHVVARLQRVSLRSPGFTVFTQGADGSLHEVPAPVPQTYRGSIVGRPGTIVGGTIRDGRLDATVALEDGSIYYVQPMSDVAPDAERGLHVVYRGDAAEAGGETCAADEGPATIKTGTAPEVMDATSFKLAEIAFDADVEFYKLNKSSVDSTIHDIEKVMSGVNVVYERDCGITHRITSVIVRTVESDPYTSFSADTMLTEMRSHWNNTKSSIVRDMAHLMTGKDLTGSTIGYSYVGVVCDRSRAYGISQSRYTTTLSRRITLTAHELGHNWNAVHCNQDPNISSPCNIMCSTINGCDGQGLPNFEPQGAQAIRNFAATRTCLSTTTTGIDAAVPAADIRLERPWPTPFHDEVSLRFHVDRAQSVRLAIYDVSGRRVATLVDGWSDAGWHVVTWDGRTAEGGHATPGMLFARLQSGREVKTQTVVLLPQ